MRVKQVVHQGKLVDIPVGVCERCGCDIEWFNGCWWVVGTCQGSCAYQGEVHVPVDELVTPEQVEEFLDGETVVE